MRISAEVEARVHEAVRATGYRPNIVSRSLRTGTTHTIAFVSDTISTTPFAGHLIWGALDAAREHGRLLFIAETEGDPELEQQLVHAVQDRQVDGIVLASMYTRKLTPPDALMDGPAVLLNALPKRRLPIPSVVPDEAEAGRTAAQTLLDAGHRDGICLIGAGPGRTESPRDSIAAVERLQGILLTLQAAHVDVAAAIGCSDWQPDHGYEATKKLLKRAIRPTALICFNDRLALGAYQALSDAGLAIPHDISVISFDDDVFATWVRPQLTTVALPHYELGRAAVELLLRQPQSSEPHVHRIPMPLRKRGSLAPITTTPLPSAASTIA
jgi:LacI family transcriptional regulator